MIGNEGPVYIDKDLINLPMASLMQRIAAYILDKILLILIPAFIGLLLSPIYTLTFIGLPNVVATILVFIGIVAGFFYMLLWGNWIRLGNTGQTFGMTIAKIAIASDPTPIENSLFRKIFFWTRIGKSNSDSRWFGDEEEERIDAQLWRGLTPVVFFPLVLLLVFVIAEIIGRVPFILISLFSGDFDLMASNKIVTYAIGFFLLAYFIIVLFGELLALNKQGRTLVDHFLGIKFVDVTSYKGIDSKISIRN